jgi:LDH2 family malate/lactate/ureidoglycolate dehydrogenase
MGVGGIRGEAEPAIVTSGVSTALVDGNAGLGPHVATFAMQLCCVLAGDTGAAVVGVRGSSHFGAASFYAELAAAKSYVGIVLSNSDPGMAPVGALAPILGTNPLAIAAPPGTSTAMPSLDMATSVVAQSKIYLALQTGDTIPSTWAIGPDGAPTTDPKAALEGSVLPMEHHKGFAIAFMIDVLTAAMTGATGSPWVDGDPASPATQDVGHLFIVINPAAFGDLSDYASRVQSLTDAVHEADRTPDTEGFIIPGDREAAAAEASTSGIQLDHGTVDLLEQLGARFTTPFTLTAQQED